jgi:hypothetical protein
VKFQTVEQFGLMPALKATRLWAVRVGMFHRAADYVNRILRGASSVALPVHQPTMLLSADEVIE